MPSLIQGFEYDIFISYRHNDNRSGWVTEFVKALQEELATTIKEPVSLYFDTNPHDGLLETHNVDKSLEGKLKCLIFIPILSQTYCDTKGFAWEHEFCAFNKLALKDSFGRDIHLSSGNVASRILPVKIHDLDSADKSLLENELGAVLRAIEFIYKTPGVNRPLNFSDKKEDNANKTFYRDQVNKVANAVKEILSGMKEPATAGSVSAERPPQRVHTPETFLEKIRKRDLPRVTLVSAIFVLLILQLSKTIVPWLGWPDWTAKTVLIVAALGFPLALVMAWLFEWSPEGIIRTSSASAAANPYPSNRKKPLTGNLVLVSLLIIVLVQYFVATPAARNEQDTNSIAVLYFHNISSDPEQDFFSDGITEEITAHLSAIKGLRVTSRTSVIPYKGKGKAINIREIARELNVDNILEGSVRKAGDKLRITAQLIDARTDEHIWTEIYDRGIADVFSIQSEIARSIAGKFKITISREANAKIAAIPTSNMEAYEFYLKARAIPKAAGGGIGTYYGSEDKAISLLKEAIALDPDFVQPYVLLSSYYQGIIGKYDSAVMLAKEAIIRDPTSAHGYIALASTQEDPSISSKWLRKAYALDTIAGLLSFADLYETMGDIPKSIQCFSQVINLAPDRFESYTGKAGIYIQMAQMDSTNKYLTLAGEAAPNSSAIYLLQWRSAAFSGQLELSRNAAMKYYGDDSLSYFKAMGIIYLFNRKWKEAEGYYARTQYRDMDLGLVMLKTGRRDSGKLILRQSLEYRDAHGGGGYFKGSRIQAALGNKAKAIEYFNKVLESGYYDLLVLRNDPFWDELREEPEFKILVEKMEKKNVEMLNQIKADGRKPFSLDF